MSADDLDLRPPVAFGITLVTYSYLGGLWVSKQGVTPAPLLVVREWINVPLGIGEDFGMLGLALLLVSGGYIVTGAWHRYGLATVSMTLTLRVVVPLLLAVALSAAVAQTGGLPLTEADTKRESPLGTVVAAAFGDEATLGLGWVVVVGAVFFVQFAVGAVLLRHWPWLACALLLTVTTVLVVTAPNASGWFHHIGVLASFVGMPLAGTVLWLVRAARLPAWAGAVLCCGCFAVIVVAERGYPELNGWWYPLTWVYAMGIVLLAATKSLPCPAVVRWLAQRAVPLLLAVGVVGYTILEALAGQIPTSVAFATAVVATGLSAEAGYRLQQALTSHVGTHTLRRTVP